MVTDEHREAGVTLRLCASRAACRAGVASSIRCRPPPWPCSPGTCASMTIRPWLPLRPAPSAVVPAFVIDDAIITRFRAHASRLAFLIDSLADLDSSLRDRGGALVVRRGDWVPAVIGAAKEAGASVIHVADDYSGYAQRRLARLETAAAGRANRGPQAPRGHAGRAGYADPRQRAGLPGVRPVLPALAGRTDAAAGDDATDDHAAAARQPGQAARAGRADDRQAGTGPA